MPRSGEGDAARAGSPVGRDGLLLRRRKQDKNPFSAAAKAFGAVVDQMESLAGKVSLDNIAASLTGALNTKRQGVVMVAGAPACVTQAFSLALTHIVAPVWAIGAKSLAGNQPVDFGHASVSSFAHALDIRGYDLDVVSDALAGNLELTTVYVCLLITKLLCIENGEYRHSFSELLGQIVRDVRPKGDYEEQLNDETVAHDQPRRRLTDVGGTWKPPRGAVEVPGPIHATRVRCLLNAFNASVMFRYYYSDEALHFVCDTLSGQLFLLSYNESLVTLVPGIKGPSYLAKYFFHLASSVSGRASSFSSNVDGVSGSASVTGTSPGTALVAAAAAACLCPCSASDDVVTSSLLESCTLGVRMAVDEFVHRNDTSDIVVQAINRAMNALCPSAPSSIAPMLKLCQITLSSVQVAEIAVLAPLMDTIRRLLVAPVPIGQTAFQIVEHLWAMIRNVGRPQRLLASSLFVAGADMRSFRRRPVHVLVSPYACRAQLATRLFTGNVEVQRKPGRPTQFAAISAALPTNANSDAPPDDVVSYLANLTMNVFQAAYELSSSAGDIGHLPQQFQAAAGVDLGGLFSLPHHVLAAHYPALHTFLSGSDKIFSDPSRMDPAVMARIMEVYASIVDMHKPVKGMRKLRLESPLTPVLPLQVVALTENEDMSFVVRDAIDRNYKLCEARVFDNDPAALHPKKELALSHFIENEVKIMVLGGGGLLRRILQAVLSLRMMYPGAVPQLCLYPIPLGFDNDVASWLAREDQLYGHFVFSHVASMTTTSMDAPTVEALLTSCKPTQESLAFRYVTNHYATHANHANEVVVYQVECVFLDGTSGYLPMLSNFEMGAHVNITARAHAFASARDHLSPTAFIKEFNLAARRGLSMKQIDRSGGSGATTLPALTLQPPPPQTISLCQSLVTELSGVRWLRLGSTDVSIEHILVRMHGTRGIPVSTRRHPSEARDLLSVAAGSDLLDWVSTTFQVYDAAESLKGCQAFLDAGLIITAAVVGSGRSEGRFHEQSLFYLRSREPTDQMPMAPPTSRSQMFDLAMRMRPTVTGTAAPATGSIVGGGLLPQHHNGSIGTQTPRVKVTFVAPSSEPQYKCFTAPVATREPLALKLRAMGSAGDGGPRATPTKPTLVLAYTDVNGLLARSRSAASLAGGSGGPASPLTAAAGEARGAPADEEQYFHFNFSTDAGSRVDPASVLSIEALVDAASAGAGPSATASSSGPGAASNQSSASGFFCTIDGDVFGPFLGVRIRPVTAIDSAASTISVMSYVPIS